MTNRKEFHELIPIGRAEDLLRSIIRSSTEVVPLDRACRRILAEDVFAPIDVPSFDRADMDGYAVRAADTYRAREEEPVQLVIAGMSRYPGRNADASKRRASRLPHNTTARTNQNVKIIWRGSV